MLDSKDLFDKIARPAERQTPIGQDPNPFDRGEVSGLTKLFMKLGCKTKKSAEAAMIVVAVIFFGFAFYLFASQMGWFGSASKSAPVDWRQLTQQNNQQ